MGDNKFEVIWPIEQFPYHKRLLEYLIQLDEMTKESISFHEIKQKIIDNMRKWYNSLSSEEGMEAKRRLYDILQSEQQELLDQLLKLKKEDPILASLSFPPRFFIGCSRLFNHDVNRTSVVFHKYNVAATSTSESYITVELSDVLMTGDIDADIVSILSSSNKLRSHYDVIKVPHHGTGTHYCSNLPPCHELLISTGLRNRYQPISARYNENHGTRYCTAGNNFCELRTGNTFCDVGFCQNSYYMTWI